METIVAIVDLTEDELNWLGEAVERELANMREVYPRFKAVLSKYESNGLQFRIEVAEGLARKLTRAWGDAHGPLAEGAMCACGHTLAEHTLESLPPACPACGCSGFRPAGPGSIERAEAAARAHNAIQAPGSAKPMCDDEQDKRIAALL